MIRKIELIIDGCVTVKVIVRMGLMRELIVDWKKMELNHANFLKGGSPVRMD